MERQAVRHAMERDAEVAEVEATVAQLRAHLASAEANLRRRELELHDAREAMPVEAAVADLLRKAVKGRRTYLRNAPDDETRRLIELECSTIESCVKVLGGDLGPLYNWLPSHMWTNDMVAALSPERNPTP